MTMMRWDPFREMMPLRQLMDRMFEDAVVQPGRLMGQGGEQGFGVAIDLMEREDAFLVKASIPGVKPDDVDISIQDQVLTIRGEAREEHERGSSTATPGSGDGRQSTTEQRGGQSRDMQATGSQQMQQRGQPMYHYRERRFGRFVRQLMLPAPVDANQADASFEDGILTITLPKAEQARRRRIEVRGPSGSRAAIEGQASQGGAAGERNQPRSRSESAVERANT